MARRQTFAFSEWYHCFNRGVDKRIIFDGERDAERFLMLLFLANGTERVSLSDMHKPKLAKAFAEKRGKQIVSIGAYCLMPNHYHLLLKEVADGGITSFMRKLGTAYTMYFNAKNERTGHLFSGSFQSRHISTDRYFQRVVEYIHCNPAELYEPQWKSGRVRNARQLEKSLLEYPYSSLASFVSKERGSPILSPEVFDIANKFSLSRMLEEARIYYEQESPEV